MALDGHLDLEALPGRGGVSCLGRQSFSAPFHVGKGYADEDGVLRVQVVNPTAGMLEGDRMRLRLVARRGASLSVTTPSASRCFRSPGAGGVEVRQDLVVESTAFLEYAPEPLYVHAGGALSQHTQVEMERGASLFLVDSLAPGRVASGELWQWRRLVLSLRLEMDGRPVLVERLAHSGPELGALAAWHGQQEAWLATAIAVAPGLGSWEAWREGVSDTPDCRFGGTALEEDVLIFRLVGASAGALRDGLLRLRRALVHRLPGLSGSSRRV